MNEMQRLKNLLGDLYNGNPWLEITLAETLENISAKTAAKKVSAHVNTIWEIVNHILSVGGRMYCSGYRELSL